MSGAGLLYLWTPCVDRNNSSLNKFSIHHAGKLLNFSRWNLFLTKIDGHIGHCLEGNAR